MGETVQLRVGYANCSDILPNWRDMQSKFGYMTLSAIQCTKMQTVRDWQNKAVVLNETEVDY